ncbi:MAG: retropepsin-like aspartic protease [Bacteroidota bacterium]
MVYQIPIRLLKVEEDGFHLMCTATVHGHPINMLIDTGASRTVFDSNRLQELIQFDPKSIKQNEQLSTGIGTNTLESQVVTLTELNLGGAILKNYTAVMIDMAPVNETYMKIGLPAIEGVLGGDILVKGKAMIDYKKCLLKLTLRKRK